MRTQTNSKLKSAQNYSQNFCHSVLQPLLKQCLFSRAHMKEAEETVWYMTALWSWFASNHPSNSFSCVSPTLPDWPQHSYSIHQANHTSLGLTISLGKAGYMSGLLQAGVGAEGGKDPAHFRISTDKTFVANLQTPVSISLDLYGFMELLILVLAGREKIVEKILFPCLIFRLIRWLLPKL